MTWHFAKNKFSPFEALGFEASGKKSLLLLTSSFPFSGICWIPTPPLPSVPGPASDSCSSPHSRAETCLQQPSSFLTALRFSELSSHESAYIPSQQKGQAFDFMLTVNVKPLTIHP